MTLERLLLPQEEIRFRAARPLKYGQSPYNAYVTNKRLVLYAQRGLIFSRDDFIAFHLKDIASSKYHEEGFISKTGYLTIAVGNTSARIFGSPIDVKQLYMAAQNPSI